MRGYILVCDDGELYFDDLDLLLEYAEEHYPCGFFDFYECFD